MTGRVAILLTTLAGRRARRVHDRSETHARVHMECFRERAYRTVPVAANRPAVRH